MASFEKGFESNRKFLAKMWGIQQGCCAYCEEKLTKDTKVVEADRLEACQIHPTFQAKEN